MIKMMGVSFGLFLSLIVFESSTRVSAFTPLRPCQNVQQNTATQLYQSVDSDSDSDSDPDPDSDSHSKDIQVMVNGMPGPMATAAAEACLRKGLRLSPVAITGPNIEPATIVVHDPISAKSASVRLIPSTQTDEIRAAVAGLQEAKLLCAIDYTHPTAVNGNALFYVEMGIPFVMGTTGGDREALMNDVQNHNCVIAPNMGKQIVAMQAALEELASKYPAAFEGYSLEVTESHQKKKADTSGTAKAVIHSLKTLASSDFDVESDVQMLRDDDSSLAFGVPEDGLDGHAFHTYTLTSPDKSVQFQLKHNVVGRNVYAEGTADGVKFLAQQIAKGGKPKVYSMINVLEQGALE